MKNLFIVILLFISLCLWAQNVPQTIDYQGRLADSDGNYLNSVVTVDFLIYDAETGGTLLWTEIQDVSCANGVFHVLLGSTVSFPSTLFDGADSWLQLIVSGETLDSRTKIASIPYAIKAETAYTVEAPLNLSENVSNPNSVITGENTGSGYGVYGKHYITDNYGYLGSSDYGVYGYGNYSGGYFEGDTYGVYGTASGYGVYGLHPSGNYGYIASSDYGVFGSSSGNFGYLGSSSYGVYGNSISNWAGYFDGKVHISDMVGIGTDTPTSKLTVAGTIESNSGGVKFPDGTVQTTAAATSTHYIGESYGGGIIFWLDTSGQHGLIAATADQSTGIGIQWYNESFTTTNAVRDGIGAGMYNTERIIANQGVGSYAAQLCANYQGGEYGDWYLPSKYELDLMYNNIGQGNLLGLGNVGGFANNIYWSSTEYSNNYAWLQYFDYGIQNYTSKGTTAYVRAIRAF